MVTVYDLDGKPVQVEFSVDAREYVATGRYSWAPKSSTGAQIAKPQSIADVFSSLDNSDPEIWTQGKPKLSVINAKLDSKVTAAQRDAEWLKYMRNR